MSETTYYQTNKKVILNRAKIYYENNKELLREREREQKKKKGDKLYVKWKGYDNSFNSWMDKKDFV